MNKSISVLVLMLILFSCGKRNHKIDYSKQGQSDTISIESMIGDTSRILVADLPIYFDSTDILIHPISLVNISDNKWSKSFRASSYSETDYSSSSISISSYDNDSYSGNMTNLMFENIKNRSKHLLTNKVLNINYFVYLRSLSHKIKRHYILYFAIDMDLNHDGELNSQDINSLYLSNLDGSNFTKITSNYHEYDDGKLILMDLKYYFRTIEDTNKDGLFSKVDKFHYFYIDFSVDPYNVVEYNPLRLIVK